MKKENILVIILSVLLFSLSLVKLFDILALGNRIDTLLIALLVLTFVLPMVPYDRIKHIKTSVFEVELDNPKVKTAISSVNTKKTDNEELRKRLKKLEKEMESVVGSRILWIDDKPITTLPARKLLRALGADIHFVNTSEKAFELLKCDQDFDLIVTDVQRIGDSYKYNDGIDIHEGVNFICKIRSDKSLPVINVIFFGGYDWERLIRFTKPARELLPEPEVANKVNDLLEKVIKSISMTRSTVIKYDDKKTPSSPY